MNILFRLEQGRAHAKLIFKFHLRWSVDITHLAVSFCQCRSEKEYPNKKLVCLCIWNLVYIQYLRQGLDRWGVMLAYGIISLRIRDIGIG